MQFGAYINSVVHTVPTCLSKVVILLFLREINSTQTWCKWSIYLALYVTRAKKIGWMIMFTIGSA